MCGRFTLTADAPDIENELGAVGVPDDYLPRYNIAPSQQVLAVGRNGERLGFASFRWGLVPAWARNPSVGSRLINARAETAHARPAFRDAFARRRCLIPADGFYEWQHAHGSRQPFHVRRVDRRVFTFAGLWERWFAPDGDPLLSCTILTCDPSPLVRPIHDRMPVILGRDDRDAWLDPETPLPRLRSLLAPWPRDTELEAVRVSTLVNDPRNDIPACLTPLPPSSPA